VSELGVLAARYRERVRDELAARPPATEGLRAAVDARMRQLLRRDGVVLAAGDAERLIAEVVDDAAGLGPLERLMRDPSVTEVMVNGPQQVWVEREGTVGREEIAFRDLDHLRHVIARIVGTVGRRVDESSPMVDARLPDGSRVNVVLPPLALDGPLVTIRRFRAAGFSLGELVASGSATEAQGRLLRTCVRGRLNVVISGGTGSGKTTLLNAVARTLDPHERIVTVEDAAELRLDLPHVVRLESRPPNVEGRGEITLRALVRNALRMRPDRIVVGEVRGGEALDMLQAMNTGHDGSLTTVHASSPADAIRRVETMMLMAGLDLPHAVVREQVTAAVDVVVHVSRQADGRRSVRTIAGRDRDSGELLPLTDALAAALMDERCS
jgi:pilus assembly protein CpaF